MRRTAIGFVVLVALTAGCGTDPPRATWDDGGIRVHGDWTIEILDEDGTSDRRLQFSNALSDLGADALVSVLTRQQVVGPWEIYLNGAPAPCVNSVGSPVACIGVESGNGMVEAGENVFDTLDVTVLPGTIRLLTTVTIQADSALDEAQTFMRTCDPDRTPEQCFAGSSDFSLFTFKDLTQLDVDGDGNPDGPIDVTTGQVVQIAVDISFSSG
ncbi:MAG: hypothetical protein HKN41_06765 [Ilumatobacter sp.]|nr:hypothetical protein [Ilumatobacter sp.]